MIPEWLSLVDVAFLGVALMLALGGFQKGFAEQVAHIITFVAMGLTLFFAYPVIFSYFGRVFRNLDETYMMWLILAGLAVLAIGFFILTSKLLANVLKTQISDRSDHAYGFILGFIRGALFALFIMIFLVMLGTPKFYESFRLKSYVGRLVCYEIVPRIQPHLPATKMKEINRVKEALLRQEEVGFYFE